MNPESAQALFKILTSTNQRIVFAESCTAGLIAAELGRIPGVSSVLAGSAVVYQPETKTAWLGVSAEVIQSAGVVSQQVSEQMARGVLRTTPHATIAASVTGHLGPDAPPALDGIAWSTVAVRKQDTVSVVSRKLILGSCDDGLTPGDLGAAMKIRRRRQVKAAENVMNFCIEVLTVG